MPADRPRAQVGQLKPARVRLLVHGDQLKGEGELLDVLACTDAAELELELVVLSPAAALDEDMG